MLAGVLAGSAKPSQRLVTKVANRLLLAQFVSFALIGIVLMVLGLPIFYFILKGQH